ncbi:hypothetical protein QE452_001867 [Sphingomonas sp. SORGH_AS438]|nr:hypothetical protein [Sphingomonas sp. SORGH_AS_0438]
MSCCAHGYGGVRRALSNMDRAAPRRAAPLQRRRRVREVGYRVLGIVIASAAKQSTAARVTPLDCFAALAMTAWVDPVSSGSSRQPPAASRQPPAASRLPPAASRQPPAACRLPPAACRLPPAACRLPSAVCRLHSQKSEPVRPLPKSRLYRYLAEEPSWSAPPPGRAGVTPGSGRTSRARRPPGPRGRSTGRTCRAPPSAGCRHRRRAGRNAAA